MVKKFYLILSLLSFFLLINAQNCTTVIWSGYVNTQAVWDSRQIATLRPNSPILLWPLEFSPDINCKDTDDHGQFGIFPLTSRLRVTALGPKNCDKRIWAMIEGEFNGQVIGVANVFKLRHAFIKFEWCHHTLLLGNFWHPLVPDDCMANTVDFNNGAPIAALTQNPQLRYTCRFNNTELLAAANMQLEDPNNGPEGTNTIYARNAIVPSLSFQVRQYFDESILGFIVNYKRLVPRLVSGTNFKVDESINSAVAMVYLKYVYDTFTMNMNFAYIENANNPFLFGGYAVKCQAPVTQFREYANIRDISWWIDLNYRYKFFEPGLFAGIIKNLGANEPLFIDSVTGEPIVFSFFSPGGDSSTISYVWRIAPRIWFDIKPVTVAAEMEFTTAAFGTLNNFAKPINARAVTDVRFLLSAFYYF
ncbi:hypothetical protein M1446_04815 [Candidatus Dependentiae bacterium]|nr:hypothetical protein [Candidatus Dependentiae bacterium]